MSGKYEKEINEILSSLHEPWMTDEDKKEFNEYLLSICGGIEDFSNKIEEGVSKGYSVEYQVKIAKMLFQKLAGKPRFQ